MILPLPALVAVTLIVLGAMIAGFAGPPASRPRPALAWTLFAAGTLGLTAAAALMFTTNTRLDSLVAAGAACLLALSARYLRQPGTGEDPPRGDDPPDDPGPPGDDIRPLGPGDADAPWDWGDFDDARAQWSARREGAER